MPITLTSDDTACIAFDFDEDSVCGHCTCGHSEDEHEGSLGGCTACAYDIAARLAEVDG